MGQKLFYFKYFLWWLGIIKNCPKCYSELCRVDKSGWVLYKCSNPNCNFGKTRTRYKLEIWKR